MLVILKNVNLMQRKVQITDKGAFVNVKFAEPNDAGDGTNEVGFTADQNCPGLFELPILKEQKELTLDVVTYISNFDTKMKIKSVLNGSPAGK